MEANKNSGTQAASNLGGFDLNGLLSSPGIGELIKHLLSAGGAALFNYLMSIKPMQEKIESLSKENKELREKIEDVEESQEELIFQINKKFKVKEIEQVHGTEEDHFPIRRKGKSSESKRKYLN